MPFITINDTGKKLHDGDRNLDTVISKTQVRISERNTYNVIMPPKKVTRMFKGAEKTGTSPSDGHILNRIAPLKKNLQSMERREGGHMIQCKSTDSGIVRIRPLTYRKHRAQNKRV